MKKVETLVLALFVTLGGWGSMSFGETVLDSMSVFGEASEFNQCYRAGGDHTLCEGYKY